MNDFDIERLHKSGKMPNRYYYQQNGRTAQQNYIEQRDKMREDTRLYFDKSELKETVENALTEILESLDI